MSLLIGTLLLCLGIQQLSYPLFVPATSGLMAISTARNIRSISSWHINIGKREIWIPILVILIILLTNETTIPNKIFFGIAIPAIYLLGLNFGDKAFKYMHWLVVIGVFSIIAVALLEGGDWSQGGVFGQYNIATATLVLGTVLSKKYWLYPITISGLCLLGRVEPAIGIFGLLLILGLSKQWKWLLISIGFLFGALLVGLTTGTTQQLFDITHLYSTSAIAGDFESATDGRFFPYKEAIKNISLFGYGYEPFNQNGNSIHNVPLIIINQIGIIGFICAMWLFGYGLFKSSYKKAWLIIGLISIFDNIIWTQLWLWLWYLLGSTQNLELRKESDYGTNINTANR